MLESKAFPIKKIYVPTNRRQTLDVEKVRVRLETHPDCASRRVSSMMEAA